VYSQFEKLADEPGLKTLGMNILFTLRCNRKVIDSINIISELSNDEFADTIRQLPTITYAQFLSAVTLNAPDENAQNFVDWINASLYIEAITLTAWIIYEENIKVSIEKIKELSSLVLLAGQLYIKLSLEGGIVKLPSGISSSQFFEDFLLQEGIQFLASESNSFDFLNEEEELYSISDLKKVFHG